MSRSGSLFRVGGWYLLPPQGTLCPAEGWPTAWQVHTPTCDCAERATQLERAGQVRGPLEHEGRTKEIEGPNLGTHKPK